MQITPKQIKHIFSRIKAGTADANDGQRLMRHVEELRETLREGLGLLFRFRDERTDEAIDAHAEKCAALMPPPPTPGARP